jgi:hypothetical protein
MWTIKKSVIIIIEIEIWILMNELETRKKNKNHKVCIETL